MKIALVTPWENAWIPHYRAEIERRGHDFILTKWAAPSDSDIVIHGWADGSPSVAGAKNIVFLRRYELFAGLLSKIDWSKTHALICVNSWIKTFAEQILAGNGIKVPTYLVLNSVDESKWTFKERTLGNKVGMACFIHSKKNLPLALQILAALPEGYELHIAGEVQDVSVAEYLNYSASALGKVLHIYGQVASNGMDSWWDGMDYCLSTSITEGNPNNVNEAMFKGIKPVIHNWPGAQDQYPLTFNSVQEAVGQITSTEYDSNAYREWGRKHFSLANIERVIDLAESLCEEREAA